MVNLDYLSMMADRYIDLCDLKELSLSSLLKKMEEGKIDNRTSHIKLVESFQNC